MLAANNSLTKFDQRVLSSHSYIPTKTPTRETIIEQICLEIDYKYLFSISDSFRDRICCIEGQDLYLVKVNDIEIIKEGDFRASESFWFRY